MNRLSWQHEDSARHFYSNPQDSAVDHFPNLNRHCKEQQQQKNPYVNYLKLSWLFTAVLTKQQSARE